MKIENLNIKFNDRSLYKDFSLEFQENEILAIMGKSGCGKTTLLKAICNHNNDGHEFQNIPDKISYVFQQPCLIPMITVKENLELVIDKKLNKNDKNNLITRALSLMHLEGFENRYPNTLSGGEQNRVGLARAFIYDAKLMLMDEPFKTLDIGLKYSIIKDFLEARKEQSNTIIMVTHDIDEAILMANRVIVLDKEPNIIAYDCKIDIPTDERKIGDKHIANVRQKIFNALTNA